jgi:hypothetical protein
VLTHDVSIGGERARATIPKGRILSEQDIALLRTIGAGELHLIQMEDDDVHEDTAAREIAEAAAAPGIRMEGPAQSQIRLVSTQRGLLDVNLAVLQEINSLPVVAVFSLYDGQVVDAGDKVGGVKVGPLVVNRGTIDAVKKTCAREGPPISVRPFRPLDVAVLDRERLSGELRRRHEEQFDRRIHWLGGQLSHVWVDQPDSTEMIARLLRGQMEARPGLIVIAGTNSTDPLDHAVQAVMECGGELIRIGMPAHPGSTYWLADLATTPVLGIGSCGMLSGATVFDILLPRYFAGLPVDREYLSGLGHGGMLNKLMKFRFPTYEG